MTLTAVRRAAQTKDRADASYRSALQAAYEAGHSYSDIARAAQVSRQAVRQLIGRAAETSPAEQK
jgi:DNA-directed RNA polymerase specialized sigma24 family protein